MRRFFDRDCIYEVQKPYTPQRPYTGILHLVKIMPTPRRGAVQLLSQASPQHGSSVAKSQIQLQTFSTQDKAVHDVWCHCIYMDFSPHMHPKSPILTNNLLQTLQTLNPIQTAGSTPLPLPTSPTAVETPEVVAASSLPEVCGFKNSIYIV